mgnify:CR=1 FL=1
MNLLDTLTLLAGMYGRYRGAREERGVRRFEALMHKDIETGKRGEEKRKTEAEVELGLDENQTRRFEAAAPVIQALATEYSAAYREGDTARVKAITEDMANRILAASAGDAALAQALGNAATAHIEQQGGVQALGLLGQIAGQMQRTGGEIGERQTAQVMPFAMGVLAKQMGVQPQTGAPGAPVAPGQPPGTAAGGVDPLAEALQWKPTGDPQRDELLALWQQAAMLPRGDPRRVQAERLFQMSVRGGSTQNMPVVLIQMRGLMEGVTPGSIGAPGGAVAGPPSYDIGALTGQITGLQRPMPGPMELPGREDYAAGLARALAVLPPGLLQALAQGAAGAPPSGPAPTGQVQLSNLMPPIPGQPESAISPAMALALATDSDRVRRAGYIR